MFFLIYIYQKYLKNAFVIPITCNKVYGFEKFKICTLEKEQHYKVNVKGNQTLLYLITVDYGVKRVEGFFINQSVIHLCC